jgi:quercetin dioxygenase-like cupin family protein
MKLHMNILALGLLAGLGGVPQALAVELAPGITYEVLKEHDASLIPGATKIVESIFIMQPGTSIDFPDGSPSMNICTSMLGQVTVTMGGKTVVRRAGDQWTEPKGLAMALENTGNVPYVDKTFEIFYD